MKLGRTVNIRFPAHDTLLLGRLYLLKVPQSPQTAPIGDQLCKQPVGDILHPKGERIVNQIWGNEPEMGGAFLRMLSLSRTSHKKPFLGTVVITKENC